MPQYKNPIFRCWNLPTWYTMAHSTAKMVDTTAFAQKMDHAQILMGLRQGRMDEPPCTMFSALAGSAALLDRMIDLSYSP